jgi:hypothetical protein
MTLAKGLTAAAIAAVLLAGCSDRGAEGRRERTEKAAENRGESAGQTLDRAGERVEAGARELAGDAREAGREIAGTVKRVTDDLIEVGDRELRVGDDTEFFRDGQRIDRDEIRPGDDIRAAFDEAGDELRAKRVEVRSKRD